jgi:hypothetical protein
MYLVFAFWAYVWLEPATSSWSYWSCLSCTAKYYAIFAVLVIASFTALCTVFGLLRFMSKGHRESLSPRTITVSPSGVVEETHGSRCEHQWSAIQRILKTKRFLALYISPNLAYLMPRRAAVSSDEWARLARLTDDAKKT